MDVVGRNELAHCAMVDKWRTKRRNGGLVATAFVAENQCHGASRRNITHVRCLGDVLANAAESDTRHKFRMADRLAPFFGWRHLHSYWLLGVDIHVDVPGLVAGLENPSRVEIGWIQTSAFVVCRHPIKGGLLGTPRSSRFKSQPSDECDREQAPLFQCLGSHRLATPAN